ncbi:Putative acyl-CoA dehydrogenase [Mycobacteroides abscessus subsp. bolletii]|uniref:acyl-CoA dehydrogenase family protein n=1 Tax=Mycobacteroides abscessus TaxID=36809 RepID=UPI0009A6AD75|nr:acyl-CoA dehydrogenase family protein [Mycobacteroides abscessus]SLE10746.1 Putative acyl-CoA dehydrogenase [Mycobacteroides abscessus subsp. bolletii]
MTIPIPHTTTIRLDEALGDPFCPRNPHGADAILYSDECAQLPLATYELLTSLGLQRLFVPPNLADIPSLIRTLTPVFARDMGLGLSIVVSTLTAALPVWHSGDGHQRRRLSELILTGEHITIASHQINCESNVTVNEVCAVAAPGGYRLSGRNELVNNAGLASTAIVLARTSDHPEIRHSMFLADLSNTRRLGRLRTTALRTTEFSGLEFTDHPVRDTDLIGAEGQATDIALKCFQVSRIVLAGAGLGPVDLAVHLAACFARQRVLYGRRVDQIPHARMNLAIAQSLLLAVETAVMGAAASLHTSQQHAEAQAAAVHYIAPLLLEYAMEHLAVILGARFYLRTGPFALFGKHYRDLAPMGISHASSVSSLLELLPKSRGLLRKVQTATQPTTTPTRLPELDLSRLMLHSGAPDPIVAWIPQATPLLDAQAKDVAEDEARSLERLRTGAEMLSATDIGATASPAAFDIAEQFTKRFVVGTALATRESNRNEFTDAWVRIAIAAINAHGRSFPTVDQGDVDVVMHQISDRLTSSRSFLLEGHGVSRSIPHLST